MTLRTKTLTAVAALTLGAAAWAQDAQNDPAAMPETAADSVVQAADDVEAVAAETEAAIVEPAEEASAEEVAPGDSEAVVEEAVPAAEEPGTMEEAPPGEVEAAEADMTEGDDPAASEAEPVVEVEAAADDAEAEAEAEAAEVEKGSAEEGESGDHAESHITNIAFSFEGPFGKFDQFQLQRGLQVYTEVCASCHGLKQVPIRTLGDEGGPQLPDDQVRAYAAQMDIYDPETEEDRPRIPADHFPTVTGMGMGPDLSLMAKARAAFHGPYGTGISQLINGIGGPEYIYSVLMGYDGEEKEQAGSVLYHNAAFAGNWISMPAPLSDDLVTYEDGTPATVDQMARDVAAFLMWTAEPHMMARQKNGFVAVIFLTILASLLYLTNKRLWWSAKHGNDDR